MKLNPSGDRITELQNDILFYMELMKFKFSDYVKCSLKIYVWAEKQFNRAVQELMDYDPGD